MTVKAGSAFFVPSTGGFFNPAGSHLFVALTDPDEKGDFISVSVMTLRGNLDQTCVLEVGDHEFVTRRSCVNYLQANKQYAVQTEKDLTSGNCKPAADVKPELLARMRRGLLASGNTPQFILDYAKKRGIK